MRFMEQYASMFVAYKHDSGTAFIVICPFLNLYGVFVLFLSKSCWEIEKCYSYTYKRNGGVSLMSTKKADVKICEKCLLTIEEATASFFYTQLCA